MESEKINKIEQIQNVIAGRSIFEKIYRYEDLNLEVNVKVHYPSLKESARIQALTSDIFLNTTQDNVTRTIYETLFLLIEADEGTKVYQLTKQKVMRTDNEGNQKPEEVEEKILLEDYFSPDKYARPEILFQVSQDINEWMGRFRG